MWHPGGKVIKMDRWCRDISPGESWSLPQTSGTFTGGFAADNSDMTVSGGGTWNEQAGFTSGKTIWTDRDYTFGTVPAGMDGWTYWQGSHKSIGGGVVFTFSLPA